LVIERGEAVLPDDEYVVNTKELVGGYVSTSDGGVLSASSVEIAVLDADVASPPSNTTWHVPTLASQVTTSKVKAMVMIGPGQTYPLTPGWYRVWFRVNDLPETPIRPGQTFKVV
jgi:hypothetical protein